VLLFQLDDPQGVLGRRRERLLAQDGQAALERRYQDRLVQEARRRDDDGVDRGGVERFLERRGGDRTGCLRRGGGRAATVGVEVMRRMWSLPMAPAPTTATRRLSVVLMAVLLG
jgi:hypothetical protein